MITLRLGMHHKSAEESKKLLDQIGRYPNSCDEVWVSSLYGFPPLEKHADMAAALAETAKLFREKGIKVSLQISNTIGHGDCHKALDFSGLMFEGSPVQNIVGPDGNSSPYCFCYYDPFFLTYMYQSTKLYAAILPDGVWIDDDLRAENHLPVRLGCYCDACIKRFNTTYHTQFSRQELIHETNFGDAVWRGRYIELIRNGLGGLVEVITRAVTEVSKDSYMAWQGGKFVNHSGRDFSFWTEPMKRISGKPPKCRPGGGFYCDKNPAEMFVKALYINMTNTFLPEYVTDSRAEIENTPDVAFGKTTEGTCLEGTLDLAYGCSGLTFATLMTPYEPVDFHGKMLKRFSEYAGYWRRLAAHHVGTTVGGGCLYQSEDAYMRKLRDGEEKFDWAWISAFGENFLRTGLPIGYDDKNAAFFLLSKDAALNMSDAEIERLLPLPVLTDGEALEILIERGFGKRFGAAVKKLEADCRERFVNEEINGDRVGMSWKLSYWAGGVQRPPYVILDRDGGTVSIGEYFVHLTGEAMGCANALIHTYDAAKKRLSRWAVFGFSLWDEIISSSKRRQIIRAADQISGGTIPAILETAEQVAVIPRVDASGKTVSVTLLNGSLERTEQLELTVRNPSGEAFSLAGADIDARGLAFQKRGTDYLLTLPAMTAWTVYTVFIA
ncbi:MAG: hypothetical protein LBH24_03770 [Clostridiales bacterium]|nr:hypothetical protein [Clostridiales bacterium]